MSEKVYELMHKDICLGSVAVDDRGRIVDVWDVKKSIFFPVYEDAGVSTEEFTNWLGSRSVPVSRMANETERNLAVFNSMGLSLTDCYWFKPLGEDMSWNDVNFYTNGFSEEAGKSFFSGHVADSSSSSPDFSLNGNLEKRWKCTGGRPLLLKRGKKPYQKEPFCEKIATEIARLMGIDHVEYTVEEDEAGYYSVCEAFTDEKTELLNAKNFLRTQKFFDEKNDFDHFVEKCKTCGIPDVEKKLDRMVVLDYLMLNVDRHWGNFGVLRDTDSGIIKELAPLFDTGMSLSREYGMVFDKVEDSGHQNIMLGVDMNRSLNHIFDPNNVDISKLTGFREVILSVLGENRYLPESDINDIADQFDLRLEKVMDVLD